MEMVIRCLILSLILALSCKLYFETLVERREWRYQWVKWIDVLAYMIGFLIIAFSEVVPYLFQPIRLIVVIFFVAQIFYQISIGQNLMMSVIFCMVYWIINTLVIAVSYVSTVKYTRFVNWVEFFVQFIILGLVMLFYCRYKSHRGSIRTTSWIKFFYFPVVVLFVDVLLYAFVWSETILDKSMLLLIVMGFTVINLLVFYFIGNILEKENKLQKFEIAQERMKNQINLYQSMQERYELQRRYMHDYKNQLICIWGMLSEGKNEEAICYTEELLGSIQKSALIVNTNHVAVNIVLNQKYQHAKDRGITMILEVNDLSKLAMSDQDIVIILVNLLDNAIEACEKLDKDKIIKMKLVLEEKELIISVKNPVKEPIRIKNNIVITTKKDKISHGIGLSNVKLIVEREEGIIALKYDDGWFYVSVVIPVDK